MCTTGKEPDELAGPVRLRIFRASSGGEARLEQIILVGESDKAEEYIGWPGEVEVRDYNLDGWLDISVPASAGNVMLFSSVYLYDTVHPQ